MLGNRTPEEWVALYARSHQHPANRFCHTIGIPLIVISAALGVSIALGVAPGFSGHAWTVAITLFVVGWVIQFVGHAIEGKPPEFFRDWRFLFVGLRWWIGKMRGRA